jgi:transcriptional regulator with XRE-family HTH domain
MTFSGRRLQELRKKAGLSQSELAIKAGLPISSLQAWEFDRRKPKVDSLLALGVGLETLAGGSASKKGKKK